MSKKKKEGFKARRFELGFQTKGRLVSEKPSQEVICQDLVEDRWDSSHESNLLVSS